MSPAAKSLADRFHGRCKPSEKAAWERAAKRDGRSLNNWIRLALNEAAKTRPSDGEK